MAKAVLVTNRFQIARYTRLRAREIRLVPNYPDSNLLPALTKHSSRVEVVIGRIGALHPESGIEESMQAVAMLQREFPNVTMALAGHSIEQYRQQIQKQSAQGSFRLIRNYHYSELPELYSQIDIVVLPHHKTEWFENLTPAKFFESLYYGVPVLVTDVGDMAMIVSEERCGVVIHEVTAEAIACGLRPLVKDPALRREMGERGRKAAMKKYNWNVAASELLSVYENISQEGD